MLDLNLLDRAYTELVLSGDIKRLPLNTPDLQLRVEEQKAYFTRRAAYYQNSVDPTLGLLLKSSGNNVYGFSVDIILRKDGTYYDIATDDGQMAQMNRNPGAQVDVSLASRWFQPTKELAGLSNPPDNPPPTNGNNTDVAELKAAVAKLAEGQNAILNSLVDILQRIQLIVDNPIEIPDIVFPNYEIKGNTAFNRLFGTVTATKK